MPQELITNASYQGLLRAVTGVLSSGLLAARKALEYQRLKTYWELGRCIRTAVSASGGELVLGDALFARISRDLRRQTGLDLKIDTIRRVVQFHRNYTRFPKKTTLTFTHYIALQRVQNPTARRRLEARAIRRDMTAEDVKAEAARLNRGAIAARVSRGRKLTVARGEPFVYYARQVTGMRGEKVFLIDCGFKIHLDFPPYNRYIPSHSGPVRSRKDNGVCRILRYKRGLDKLYTYPATVTRVVDGDTLDARIDVGFGIRLSDRLRLKGVNAPELKTPAGRKAREFLKDRLDRCPVIIVRTSKAGMYGRWLADVFSLAGCGDPHRIAIEGAYVNQALLDEGMAELYR